MRFCDRTGQVYGRLTALRCVGKNRNRRYDWECQCACGAVLVVDGGSLGSGNTTSCGCYLKERITKHGGWKKSSYNTWRAMMRRCYTITDKDYPRYGGRGVHVAPAWHDYLVFEADMGEPTGEQTLDRVDPYGDYTPANCRWADLTTQARNIRARTSRSGHRGIYATPNGKWMAAITAKRKKWYGTCRDTVEEAVADRKELERVHWGDA